MAYGRDRRKTLVVEVRIYIEGGGDQRSGKALIREGFSKLLSPVKEIARQKHIRWNLIACGGRNAAFDGFKNALHLHPDAFNVLLVDAEGSTAQSPWLHLKGRDGWCIPVISDDQCHLMVQTMEAWIIADKNALTGFYGEGFRINLIPNNVNVEQIDKANLENSLREATRHTQKGEYHKILHAPKILGRADPYVIRKSASYCERLFSVLTKILH